MPQRRQNSASEGGDDRSDLLDSALAWATREAGYEPQQVEPLAGDVSTRRYLRLHGTARTTILTLYPPEVSSACERFALSSRILEAAGIRVPRVLAVDCASGRMLLEDVGRTTLYEERHRGWNRLRPYLEEAVAIAHRLAEIPAESVAALNPPLDRTALRHELVHTWRVALGDSDLRRAGFSPSLESALSDMLDHLGRAPRSVAHRDFMARNLVPLAAEVARTGSRLAVLDHQDLRLAPAAYDLASLVNDSLYPPPELERSLLADLLVGERALDYHRAAAQRCLKIVGTFIAFEQRGNDRHRPLVGPSLKRARHHLSLLPEMQPVATAIDDLLVALAESRPSD